MLHLIDIYFLTCICLWQISQIHTCLRVVVGPGLVRTSPVFMRCIASHPAGPHGRLAKKNGIRGPIGGGGRGRQICQTAVTAPPREGCVVWSHNIMITIISKVLQLGELQTNEKDNLLYILKCMCAPTFNVKRIKLK